MYRSFVVNNGIRNGVGLHLMSKYMGHKQISTTDTYYWTDNVNDMVMSAMNVEAPVDIEASASLAAIDGTEDPIDREKKLKLKRTLDRLQELRQKAAERHTKQLQPSSSELQSLIDDLIKE